MARWEKLLAGMRDNPCAYWAIEDLETVAAHLNIRVRRGGGSHASFWHPAVAEIVTVAARRPIKPVYVKAFVALADQLEDL